MAAPLEQIVDLTIRNDVAELALVSDRLERFGAELGLAVKPLMQLQAALDEIAGNVIEHGWPDTGPHELHVRITGRDDRVEIEIDDDGQEFDPRLAPPPEPIRPGARPKLGGVGIHMAKRLVDRLDYRRVDGRNRTVIMKRCAPERVVNCGTVG
jgi:anti-sigma regulatory factor (Ser/Thr protein kinase)